jgi:DNA modification methylase
MTHLTHTDRDNIIHLLQEGKHLPESYRAMLFPDNGREMVEATPVYQLLYKGKKRKEDVIADTPSAPLQETRVFNEDNPWPDGWRNQLIFGDNLMALKAIYDDQRGLNHYGTKNRIKLVYIDPPFATKQDFMKDREKAYRDKIIGAQFIEFLRKRLILLREILADDGSIYVHLDWKKGHYLKVVLDEVFGEENFRNEIIWDYSYRMMSLPNFFNRKHDTIYFYAKTDNSYFEMPREAWTKQSLMKSRKQAIHTDEHGVEWIWMPGGKGHSKNKLRRVDEILDDGKAMSDVWNLGIFSSSSSERQNYPTQKPETLLERIIAASCPADGIVLDCFAGSGTTLATAEKLGRRWIGMDCGKLAIYTIQKRMLNLTSQVGSAKKDERTLLERTEGLDDLIKQSAGLLLVTEKAKKGELVITERLLDALHGLVSEVQRGGEFSLVCPQDKFAIRDFEEDEDGRRIIIKDGITYVVSFIEPKQKAEKEQPLTAKSFSLSNAGIYDNQMILSLPWDRYRDFVLKLFSVRATPHTINGFSVDGYIGTDPAWVWNYPDKKNLTLDEVAVKELHSVLGGKAGARFYLIAPVISFSFMMDEIRYGSTTYTFLKVPISVLQRLIEKKELGAFKQPTSENDVNEVIDAVGFDFITQPMVEMNYLRQTPAAGGLFDHGKQDYSIRLTDFRSDTLASSPYDFQRFETLSMVLIDFDFDQERNIFSLDAVHWAEDLVAAELKRLDKTVTGSFTERAAACKQLDIRIPEDKASDRMMVILVDKYGNEKSQRLSRKDFR